MSIETLHTRLEANGYAVQYPVGLDKQGNPVIGVFANRTHEVIQINECMIQNQESEKIAKFICEFAKQNNISVYNEETRKGLLRHIVIKVGIKTNEIMCVLVLNGKKIKVNNVTWVTLSSVHAISPTPIVTCGHKGTKRIEN